MFNQACKVQLSSLQREVLRIYVGVSLQRSANEPLVSSMEGGVEAMLPGYW